MNKQIPQLSNCIYYEITSGCNLKCIHCSDLLQECTNRLAAEDILSFHNKMLKYNITNCVITGGEPSLHYEFEAIINDLAKISDITITTNGTILNNKNICKILKNNPNVILQISMDGYTRETFESIRGINTYDKVMGLLHALKEHNLYRQTGVSMTLMKQNIHEVEAMIDFASDNNLAFIHFPALLPVGLACERWDTIAPDANSQIEIEEMILSRMADERCQTAISSNRIDQIITYITTDGRQNCLNNFTIKIAPDGEILPCPAAPSNKNLSLGNISEPDIHESIIQRLNEKMNMLSRQTSYNLSTCAECSVNQYCQGRFCSNCRILNTPTKAHTDYTCQIMKYHLTNALNEMRDETD